MSHHEALILRIVVIALVAIGVGVSTLHVVVPSGPAVAVAQAPAPASVPAVEAAQAAAPASVPDAAQPAPDQQPAGHGEEQPGDSGGPSGGGDHAEDDGVLVSRRRRRGGIECATPHEIAQVVRSIPIHAVPGGRRIAELSRSSKYLDTPMRAWVQERSVDGRWGRVTLPWNKSVKRSGWIRLDGVLMGDTRRLVVADLSDRTVTVFEGCRAIFRTKSAVGRAGSPSPTGRFWISDRVAVPPNQRSSFGSFAFGLSTVQPNLPVGWTGGDQMAIHGTGAPGSIGEAASAGCLRVDEDALRRLRPVLELGTPVVIQR